ncbi:hypothetical protein [Ammoniphilus oxalaticus]
MGFLFNQKECQELQYLLRRELEELLLDLGDKRIDGMIRMAMEERYTTVFKMYGRLASPTELAKYVRNKTSHTVH